MSKFTPGPWIADGNGFSKSYNISNSEKSICDIEVDRADACLIAAAPEMYEALQIARMQIANDLETQIQQGVEKSANKVILKIIEAAISKADGV